jgi:hypothetical protein
MRGTRLRYLLPLVNLAIDAAMLGLLARSIDVQHRREKWRSEQRRSGSIRPVALVQEGQAIEWDPVYIPPPPQIQAILFGTLPAGVASEWAALSGGGWRSINLRWACIHEGFAVLVWFGVGWLAEAAPRRRWILRFVWLRAASVPASLSGPTLRICVLLLVLAWVAGALWLAAGAVVYGYRLVLRREK